MKKFTAFLAAIAIGSAAVSAATINPDVLTNAKYELTPKAQEFLQKSAQRARMGTLLDGEQMMTRSWVDSRAGIYYDFSILLTNDKISDLVSFEGGVHYPFDMIPYYGANFILQGRKINPKNNEVEDIVTYITWLACWPTYYVYDQVFTYTGTLEDGRIPIADRDYEPVSMSQLANDPTFTQRFQEVDVIGSNVIQGTKKWQFFTLLENAMSAADASCVINSEACLTSITKTGDEANPTYISSTFDFNGFDSENSELDSKMTVYYKKLSSGSNGVLRLAYVGGARIEGFEPITTTLPEFGTIHLFNAGEWSSDAFGDTNPFTGAWGPFTALYLATGDTNLIWKIDETAMEFTPDIIQNAGLDVPNAELDMHANSITGYLFADPKYARDTNLNPTGEFFNCRFPIEFQEGDREISYILVPVKNCFVPYGYNYDSWSKEYGLLATVNNFPEMPITGSQLAWGTTEGFRASMKNAFKKTVEINSTGDVVYHYDPTDMSKVRTFSSIGEVEYASGVKGVMVGTAIITAGNGQINVKPGVAAPVAVYTLDGLCVINTNAAEGETVSVPAAKGIYVVTVDGKATKIAL